MIQPNNKIYNHIALVLGMSLLTFIVFWGFTLIVPKPIDDIPLAQGLVSTPPLATFTDITVLPPLAVIILINLVSLIICKKAGFSEISYILFCAIFASLCGIFFALSPLGDAFSWNLIIYFHLKRSDYNIDFLLNAFRGTLALGVGISICTSINLLRWLLRKKLRWENV